MRFPRTWSACWHRARRVSIEDADREGEPGTRYFDLDAGWYADLETRPGVIVLGEIKRARGVVKANPGASLVDLGDGVLCLEFHSKMNSLGEDMVQMVTGALDEMDRGFEALVIANEGENFSVGAQPDDGAAGRAGGRVGRTRHARSGASRPLAWR